MKGPVANLLHVESQRHIISPDVLAFDYLNNGDHSIEYKLGFESKYDPEFIKQINDIEVVRIYLERILEEILEQHSELDLKVYEEV